MSSREEPRPVQDALRRVARELGSPEPSVFAQVRDQWADLVGAAIAAHSRPVHLRAGVLRVEVDDPAWAGQFRYLGDGLVEALAARAPRAGITRISVGVRAG